MKDATSGHFKIKRLGIASLCAFCAERLAYRGARYARAIFGSTISSYDTLDESLRRANVILVCNPDPNFVGISAALLRIVKSSLRIQALRVRVGSLGRRAAMSFHVDR